MILNPGQICSGFITSPILKIRDYDNILKFQEPMSIGKSENILPEHVAKVFQYRCMNNEDWEGIILLLKFHDTVLLNYYILLTLLLIDKYRFVLECFSYDFEVINK